MFNCSDGKSIDRLTTIYVSSDPTFALNLPSITTHSEMFKRRKYLKGEHGTQCGGSNPFDKTYARIDDPDNGKPGYFTAK